MKKRKILKSSIIALAALLTTASMVGGVYAATQTTLTATDNIEFVALGHVDAIVKIEINDTQEALITFDDTKDNATHNNQSVTLTKIEGDKWLLDETTPANEIDRYATVRFTVTNTSEIAGNLLSASINRTGSAANCTITDPAVATVSNIVKDGTAVFEYRFYVDGLHDVVEFTNQYTLTLVASK